MNAAPRAPEDYKKNWDRTEKAVTYHRTGDPSVGPEHLTVEHARAIRDQGITPWQATGETAPAAPASPLLEPTSPTYTPASPTYTPTSPPAAPSPLLIMMIRNRWKALSNTMKKMLYNS